MTALTPSMSLTTTVMKSPASLTLVLFLTFTSAGMAAAQTAADRAEAAARGYDGMLAVENFIVAWRTAEGTEADVRKFLEIAESRFESIRTVLGDQATPTQPIVLVLAGHARTADGRWRVPSVDDQGRVILVRFADGISAYAQELTHELVHAFRRHSGYWLSGFLEEGFAEAIAMEAQPDDVGFPRYGYPLAVAAGHLFARGEDLPLAAIRDRHDEVGRQCQLQAYLERASFFGYLQRRGGVDGLISLVWRDSEPDDEDYRSLFGGSFAELVADWMRETRSAYEAFAEADEIAARYRAEPAVASRQFCDPGDAVRLGPAALEARPDR